jgi:RHS repeat-associated protein
MPLPGGASAVYYTGSTVTFYAHSDWLGSTRLLSGPTRTTVPTMAYAPFGEGYAGGSPTYVTFTSAGFAPIVDPGQNDNGTLDDFLFRHYSPGQGRWISPDPAGLAAVDPTNPQTWNRYAYVANNPLSFVDPSGLNRAFPGQCEGGQGLCSWEGGGVDPTSLGDTGGGGNDCWTASCGTGGIVNGPFGEFGTAGISAGFLGFPGWMAGGSDGSGESDYTTTTPVLGDGTSESPYLLIVNVYEPYEVFGPQGNLQAQAASFGGWLQQGLTYLKNHPVFISVNEILAGQITVQWSTKTVCGNLGAGASVPPTKAVTVGLYNNGNMSNWTNILSSWGYSFGSNLIVGYQASTNSSGTLFGPTISGVGLSGSYTYGGCLTVP